MVYAAIDPEAPATQSPAVVRLMREEIGFGGLLMTDDLSMKALGGGFAERVGAGARGGLRHRAALQRRSRARWREVVAAAPELAGGRRGAGGGGAGAAAGASRRTTRPRWPPSSPRCGSGRMPEDFFDAEGAEARLAAEALVVDVDGYEGPLDLLLTLAR